MARQAARVMYREARGLPVTLRPGRPVVALCQWQDFNYDRTSLRDMWLPRDEPPTACRASLGDEKLTVWLPQGARIVLRFTPGCAFDYTHTHLFGSHDRYSRTRIVIRLTEYPHG
jgi:hypothetical protein